MMGALLEFVCRCGHSFASREWIGWGPVCDATCPKCGWECSVEAELLDQQT